MPTPVPCASHHLTVHAPTCVHGYTHLHVCVQFGGSVAVKPEDRRNLVLGLVLHDKARDTLKRVRGE